MQRLLIEIINTKLAMTAHDHRIEHVKEDPMHPWMRVNLLSHSTKRSRRSWTVLIPSNNFLWPLLGFAIGVSNTLCGFYFQEIFPFVVTSSWWYSPAWNAGTGLLAYAIFLRCGRLTADNGKASSETRRGATIVERNFVVAVILGVCGACAGTDLVFGLPLRGTVLTGAFVALAVCVVALAYRETVELKNVDASPVAQAGTNPLLPLLVV